VICSAALKGERVVCVFRRAEDKVEVDETGGVDEIASAAAQHHSWTFLEHMREMVHASAHSHVEVDWQEENSNTFLV